MRIMRKKRSVGIVKFNASDLALGSIIFEISQNINSPRTKAKAKVIEKVSLAIRLRSEYTLDAYSACDWRKLRGASAGK